MSLLYAPSFPRAMSCEDRRSRNTLLRNGNRALPDVPDWPSVYARIRLPRADMTIQELGPGPQTSPLGSWNMAPSCSGDRG